MITGFNTDVQHAGVTYHVQTEDKGLDSPLLLSLVYVGGAIIASKRTPYEDLIDSGFDEQVLTERLQRQHKLICAAIKAGRVEELKRMAGQNASALRAEPVSRKAVVSSEVKKGEGAKEVKKGEGAKGGGQRRKKSEAAQPLVKSVAVDEAASETGRGELLKLDSDFVIITTMADEISALEDFKAPPSPKADTPHKVAPPVQDEASQLEPQPVLSPPSIEAEGRETPQDSANEIYVSLLEDEGDFRAGQLATVKIHVGRGAYGQKPVTDASVIVKVLGTSFRPIIMTATTDDHGVAIVRALLPRFTSGRAAIIIRAVSGEDWAEMRRIIHQD